MNPHQIPNQMRQATSAHAALRVTARADRGSSPCCRTERSLAAWRRALTMRGQTVLMPIEQWWPKLQQPTRDWLIANNGDAVPPAVMAEIAEAGGPATSDAWWVTD